VTPSATIEPACPPEQRRRVEGERPIGRALVAVRRPFDAIPRATWDALADRNPWATPFSRWAFHRAWWDAYGTVAHDETLVVVDAGTAGGEGNAAQPAAIVPLMHRHEVEPSDELTRTKLRHGSETNLTPVPATATAVFMGASYHADYATFLADPSDMPAVTDAVAEHLAGPPAPGEVPWDVVDLRRLRCGDPNADGLAAAFGRREISCGWTLNVEREDVCPVLTLPEGIDFEEYLETLEKKHRHEIRRKIRRAAAAGQIELVESSDPLSELPAFIELHQKKWGADGLFPPTPGGERSRTFVRRMFEEFGPHGMLRLSFLSVGGRRVAAGAHFDDGHTVAYYNAGIDPDAKDLSPGVVMIAWLIRRAIELGRRRVDFLRGNEPYKYEWGAVDEPLQRVLVRRTAI